MFSEKAPNCVAVRIDPKGNAIARGIDRINGGDIVGGLAQFAATINSLVSGVTSCTYV